MRVLLQRVERASVTIDGHEHAEIYKGYLLLLGIESADTPEDVEWLCRKITSMRLFPDDMGKMNISINEIQGEILIISQFTLHASTKKGNRPSFVKAARPEHAIPLYKQFVKTMQHAINGQVKSGVFGANMQVHLVNDGPVTILVDSKVHE